MGGIGIWCMHFIGNRAIQLEGDTMGQIVYSSGFTAASFFLPIIVLTAAFYVLGAVDKPSSVYIAFSGALTGLAVCGMHYLGQQGIANYHCSYSIAYVAGACTIAIFASLVALTVFFRMRANWSNQWWKRAFCGCILACAVSGMHWVATVGTFYRPRADYSISPSQLSRTGTVIVCTVLGCAACVLLLTLAILTSRTSKLVNSRAQQLVLACAYFDENGRILVTTEGQLPTTKITDQYVERTFRDDEFSKSHPAFLWIFRATRNWATLRDFIPGMKDHLFLNSTTSRFQHSSQSGLSEDDDSSYQDFETLFKEMFCVSASDLATQIHQPLESMGVLYEEPLETGTLTRRARQNLGRRFSIATYKSKAADAEAGDETHYFGQGHFLFVIRNVSKSEAEKFGAIGYRFAAISQIVDVQARSMQILPPDLSNRLISMRDYATSENLIDQGVHLVAFVMRPNVRKGFDVLVTKDKSNQLPLKTLPIENLNGWQLEYLSQLDGMSVSLALKFLMAKDDTIHQKEADFGRMLYRAMSDLVELVDEPTISQAKFSAKKILAPCRPHKQTQKPGKCILLSIRLITNLHASSPDEKLVYKPLRLFNAQQHVYAGLADHEAFARQIHRDFFHCGASTRDAKSDMSLQSRIMPRGSTNSLWTKLTSKSIREELPTAEKSLISNAGFGGIMVSNQVSVDVSEFAKTESGGSMELDEMGTTGDAAFAAEDPKTFVDDLYTLFK